MLICCLKFSLLPEACQALSSIYLRNHELQSAIMSAEGLEYHGVHSPCQSSADMSQACPGWIQLSALPLSAESCLWGSLQAPPLLSSLPCGTRLGQCWCHTQASIQCMTIMRLSPDVRKMHGLKNLGQVL